MLFRLTIPHKDSKTIVVNTELHALIRAFAHKYGLRVNEATYILIGRGLAIDLGIDPKQIELPDKRV